MVALGQETQLRSQQVNYPNASRVIDSILAMNVPLLKVPSGIRNRSLPPVVDNSVQKWWPGIYNQGWYAACQQYAGVVYTFAYEINRLRHLEGDAWENRYPAHYTWNFMNNGDQFAGVNFLQSFEVIRKQGHLTNPDFIWDTTTQQQLWTSGYEKYYRGMRNRISEVYAIEINSEVGINTLKNYLYDHLDGSSSGGIACFTTSSQVTNIKILPAGTPEAGKEVVVSWPDRPIHGLTIIGYNDSIRCDINGDGQFSNNIDINGDGSVDARDWEIGGFRFANSFGDTWSDSGFCYVLYSGMASNFESGGVWNNRVYVVDADTAYHPLLTMKARLQHDRRGYIRVIAGINADTLSTLPSKVISFPIFNFQGEDHCMTGLDKGTQDKSLEFGLDITPLIDDFVPGKAARLFFGVEERDTSFFGTGTIRYASFLNYINGEMEIPVCDSNKAIGNNEITYVSAIVEIPAVEKVRITTTELPAPDTTLPYSFQLAAEGGLNPCQWTLCEGYLKQPFTALIPAGAETPLAIVSEYRTYAAVKLPFGFPFFGRSYDSIYINLYGFVSFEPQSIPAPYITDESSVLNMFPLISPAFSQLYIFFPSKGDGMFYVADSNRVLIRWKATVHGFESMSNENFALVLYPDGRFQYIYGHMDNTTVLPAIYSGVSKGDQINGDIAQCIQGSSLEGSGYRYFPPVIPAGINISRDGLLTVSQFDSTIIYNLGVKVTDGHGLSDSRSFQLSSGLGIRYNVLPDTSGRLGFGVQAAMMLILENKGQTTIHDLNIILKSTDSSCYVSDSSVIVESMGPGESATLNTVFSFGLAKQFPPDYCVQLELLARAGADSWTCKIDIPVAASRLEIRPPEIADGDNSMLEPGEIADLVIRVDNSGNMTEESLEVSLQSMDPLITILSESNLSLGDCSPYSSSTRVFRLKRSKTAIQGSVSLMKAVVSGNGKVFTEKEFELAAGKKVLALIDLSDPQTSLSAMCEALDSLQVTYDTLSNLKFKFDDYQNLFLMLGCSTAGFYIMPLDKAQQLAGYLTRGGNIYLESYTTWHYYNRTALHPMFNYSTAKCPKYYFNEADGIEGTFTNQLSFAYNNPLNFASFSISPLPPAFSLFENRDTVPQCLEFAFAGDGYKTIGTMLGFAAKTESSAPSTHKELMRRYLDFFEVNLTGLHALFHADPGPLCSGQSVQFTDDSYDEVITWRWEFPGGVPDISTLSNPVVRYDVPGSFNVKLTVSDGINFQTLERHKYMSVKDCGGIYANREISKLRIFPNPAHDRVTILSDFPGDGKCALKIMDYCGRIVKRFPDLMRHENGTLSINVGGLAKGLYIIILSREGVITTGKLLVN